MSVDGAERKKQRIDALSDKIREHGASGIPISALISWAARNQGLRETTIRENLKILEEALNESSEDMDQGYSLAYHKNNAFKICSYFIYEISFLIFFFDIIVVISFHRNLKGPVLVFFLLQALP